MLTVLAKSTAQELSIQCHMPSAKLVIKEFKNAGHSLLNNNLLTLSYLLPIEIQLSLNCLCKQHPLIIV